jgi:hypothetical protein
MAPPKKKFNHNYNFFRFTTINGRDFLFVEINSHMINGNGLKFIFNKRRNNHRSGKTVNEADFIRNIRNE